jgi:serine/threonine-protein phosphatase 6 regulatory ankyrin repeat subunit B
MTPAVAALAGGYFQLAQLLSHNGSSVEPRDFNMWSPLHWAAHYGDLEVMQVLLDCRADIDSRTNIDRTPLHEAVGKSSRANGPTVICFMLDHGANVNARMQGTTPLHLASKYGRLDVVRLLIEHGTEVEAKDSRDQMPLQLTSAEGQDEVVDLLLEYGTK